MPGQKNILRYCVILLIIIGLGSWTLHEFYVSLTEVRFNPQSSRIEVSIRVFPDDLDRALLDQHGIYTQLASELEAPEADSLLMLYLLKNFTLEVDGHTIKLEYLGKEAEADAIWCYLESETLTEPKIYQLSSSILIQSFEDQVNIIQVYQGKWNKGLMLSRDQLKGTLTVEE